MVKKEILHLFRLQSHPLGDVAKIRLEVAPLWDLVQAGLAPAGDESLRKAEFWLQKAESVSLRKDAVGLLVWCL